VQETFAGGGAWKCSRQCWKKIVTRFQNILLSGVSLAGFIGKGMVMATQASVRVLTGLIIFNLQ
jgi:hypothetical protein